MSTRHAGLRWREARREAARAVILEAAWSAAREEGLTSLSLRRLAARAGITPPTVYAYFPSKNAIYDAMFFEAAAHFEAHMAAPYDGLSPDEILVEGLRRFLEFCTSDSTRYELLFQRVVPQFEPSPEAYEPAVRALDNSKARLRAAGVVDQSHVDLWTALTTGLASQQIANDPGGQRWVSLASQATSMFLAHCRASSQAPPK
ncbi:MAG TPA: TetR/AcrR family transcriptional regulator [Marmoricola sp.]